MKIKKASTTPSKSNQLRNVNITSFEKDLESSVEIWWYFVPTIFVKKNLSPSLLWWSSLQTKEGQRHTEFLLVRFENSQTPSTTTVYDPVIIEWTIGLVFGPSTALYEPFLKHCTLTNKAVGTIWRALSKPPQRRHGPDLRPLWLLVGTPSAIIPELAFSRAEHSRPFSDVAKYIFDIYYLLTMLFVYWFLWPLRLVWLFVCCLYKEVYLKKLNVCPFDYTAVAGSGKAGP